MRSAVSPNGGPDISYYTTKNAPLLSVTSQKSKEMLRKAANYEFFALTLLSHKMNNQRIPQIMNLNPDEMFKTAT